MFEIGNSHDEPCTYEYLRWLHTMNHGTKYKPVISEGHVHKGFFFSLSVNVAVCASWCFNFITGELSS